MRNLVHTVLISALFVAGANRGANAATLNGNSLALKSTGDSSGSAWVLDRDGFVGTYVTLPQAGAVTISVSADGVGAPTMSVAVGDATKSFSVSPGAHAYSQSLTLPAGTHFLRAALNGDPAVGGRQLKVNSLSIEGASVANSQSNENALAAADTYINNYRKGPARVKIDGLSAGEKVDVSLKRIGFNFGAGVEGGPLNLHPTAPDARYQAKVLENFNTVATNGSGMWAVNEENRGEPSLGHLEWIGDWAKANKFKTHFHTLLYDLTDPGWVKPLKQQAVTSASARTDLLQAIADRTGYIFGNPKLAFDQMQIYNESFSTGHNEGGPSVYWNLFGAEGIAKFYRDAHDAAANIGRTPTLYSNDGWVLELSDDKYVNDYVDHVLSVQNTRYGKVMDAMGLQFYTTGADPNLASRVSHNLSLLEQAGLPMSITEFGAYEGTTPEQAAESLDKTMRLIFGRASTTGMTIWDWTNYSDGEQWAPYTALYNVSSPSFDNWEITPAGKVWQDRLGIRDWDGDPNNGWTTQLTATAAADGSINFTGFYGDYELTVGSKVYRLSLTKGVTQYELGESLALAGDFNGDGKVDAADYSVWRNKLGTTFDLHGNGNEDGASAGRVDQADFQLWKANFGRTSGGGSVTGSELPEPRMLPLVAWAFVLLGRRQLGRR